MNREVDKKAKEDVTMGAYVKPIQATPTLKGADAAKIVKQALTVPSEEAIERNKKLLEIRKKHVTK